MQWFPLKFSIPVILILFTGSVGWVSFQKEVAFTDEHTEQTTKEYIQHSANQTVTILDYLFRHRDLEQTEIIISQLGSDSNLDTALVLNEKNIVLICSHYETRLLTVDKTLAAQYVAKFPLVRQQLAGKVFLSPAKDKVIAIYPVLLYPKRNELRSSKIGILFIQYDLARIKKEAYKTAVDRWSLYNQIRITFCLFLWLFFEFTYSRRVAYLVQVSNSLAQGDLAVRASLSGGDELTQISVAFNRMAENIQKSTIQLKESEERYNLAATGINDAVWDWNIKTGKVYYKEVWEKILGYPPEESYHNELSICSSIVHPEDMPSQDREIADHFSGKTEIYESTHRKQHYLGHYIWTYSKAKCLFDETGKPSRLVGLTTDITAKKQAEKELQVAKEAAETANIAKSQFLAKMSHELRTPLNAIIGFNNLIIKDDSLSPTNRKYLEIATRSGEHLLGLINDVLDVSKVEAGQTKLNENYFDLHNLLYLTRDMLSLKTESKGIEFKLEIDTKVPRQIYGDEGKIRQILLNLIGNAIKFTFEGYILVEVKAEKKESKYILKIEIQDTGIGISAEAQDLIFEPFQQAEQADAENGTGLGLSISRQFARLMGGDITIESSPGNGSTFSCYLEIAFCPQKVFTPERRNNTQPLLRNTLSDIIASHLGTPPPYPSPAKPIEDTSRKIIAQDLRVMSEEWIYQMHRAAILLDEQGIRQLISQIPEKDQDIANSLNNLLDELQFEEILELTET